MDPSQEKKSRQKITVCPVVGHSTHESMYYKEYSYSMKHVQYPYLPWLLTDR